MLEPIVRVNNARNSGVTTVGEIKRKLPAHFVGKIGVKERANPGPSTFWNGNEDGVATGKLAGATAEVPSHDATNPNRVAVAVERSLARSSILSPRYCSKP